MMLLKLNCNSLIHKQIEIIGAFLQNIKIKLQNKQKFIEKQEKKLNQDI